MNVFVAIVHNGGEWEEYHERVLGVFHREDLAVAASELSVAENLEDDPNGGYRVEEFVLDGGRYYPEIDEEDYSYD